ncbi:TIGR02186 family protein [Sphingomonas colocasiae]|uniref:TIGR02186 family protein n=1 Tax=Sphingomonas colocasiae TaxID=1848973 RepID=A0ABS7PP92_9SPHN|nr:TIGR02186 family protein [Sphingomonas colocasiae]MBY8822257.1 TIGR02186 family protein [Sphingomonas colocasiae]
MRRAAALSLFALAPLLLAADKPVLVPDVSQRDVEIRYSFTGAELLLFGAILYPGGRVPAKPAEVAVVLRGPVQPIVVREKQKVAGIWVNAESVRFRSAPAFYAVASSRPLDQMVDARTAAIFELGLGNLQLSPANVGSPGELSRFEDGLIDLRRRTLLYGQRTSGVEITDGVLYRARLVIPARVPVGRYTAETFLIQDGRVIAGASRDVAIRKTGFEGYVADAAEHSPVAYGLFATAMSVLLGWAAGALFRRR